MTVEPMTDEQFWVDASLLDVASQSLFEPEPIAALRRWADFMRAENSALNTRSGVTITAATIDAALARLDAERTRADAAEAERDRHANAYIDLHGQHVTKMLELADARSALKRAEAERDRWRDIETAPHDVLVLLYCPDRGPTNRERIELGYASHGSRNDVASSLGGHAWATKWQPLPDLPTPTAAQEG